MYQKSIFIGHLGKDVELKTTKGGQSVASFSLATSFGSGEKERTEWHNITAWDKTAELAAKFLKKGSKVFVEGRIQTDKVEGEQGIRYFTKIIADRIQFLDKKGEDGASSSEMPF